ncbi:MAG TPA: hypothetical protein VFA65_24560 [Bryobacteraceae bacterium]|nr:hypothetical protein [Bryobacteraceae bacterium]
MKLDDHWASTKEHAIALAVRAIAVGLDDLCETNNLTLAVSDYRELTLACLRLQKLLTEQTYRNALKRVG